MGRERGKKKGAWFWGLGTPGIGRSPIMREMTADAMAVYANIRYSANNQARANGEEDIPWGYADGPVVMRRESTARGLFTIVRLGLIVISDGGAFREGSYRKSRYRVSMNWTLYNADRPGRFIVESPDCSAHWKACFDGDGKWAPGVNPKIAPTRARNGRTPVRHSGS